MNVFEWKWYEIQRNDGKCVEMNWGNSKCMFLGCHSIFFNFLLFTAISIWFQLISSMSLHYLIFAIVFTQYAVPFIPLIAVFLISFQFFSFHFLSNTFVFFIFNVLLSFRWLSHPGWLQKVNKIMILKVLEWSELFHYQCYWNSS